MVRQKDLSIKWLYEIFIYACSTIRRVILGGGENTLTRVPKHHRSQRCYEIISSKSYKLRKKKKLAKTRNKKLRLAEAQRHGPCLDLQHQQGNTSNIPATPSSLVAPEGNSTIVRTPANQDTQSKTDLMHPTTNCHDHNLISKLNRQNPPRFTTYATYHASPQRPCW